MSKSNSFDKLYGRVEKILELYPKIPPDMWHNVFETLYEAAKEGEEISGCEKEIMAKSKECSLTISDIANISSLKSYIDKTLCFVSYLERIGIEQITSEHIQTCYFMEGEEIADEKLSQNLRDLVGIKYGYLIFNKESYKLSDEGKDACVRKRFLPSDNEAE